MMNKTELYADMMSSLLNQSKVMHMKKKSERIRSFKKQRKVASVLEHNRKYEAKLLLKPESITFGNSNGVIELK